MPQGPLVSTKEFVRVSGELIRWRWAIGSAKRAAPRT